MLLTHYQLTVHSHNGKCYFSRATFTGVCNKHVQVPQQCIVEKEGPKWPARRCRLFFQTTITPVFVTTCCRLNRTPPPPTPPKRIDVSLVGDMTEKPNTCRANSSVSVCARASLTFFTLHRNGFRLRKITHIQRKKRTTKKGLLLLFCARPYFSACSRMCLHSCVYMSVYVCVCACVGACAASQCVCEWCVSVSSYLYICVCVCVRAGETLDWHR